jgi:hypothetical protein
MEKLIENETSVYFVINKQLNRKKKSPAGRRGRGLKNRDIKRRMYTI